MEGTMEQFTEKLAGLVELGKKNKNFLEDVYKRQSPDFLELEKERWQRNW